MSAPAVHNVRFYKPKPYAAYCMVLKKSENLLAVGRSDDSIEIWNLNNAPFIERRIPPIVDNNYTQQLCWCNDRLFSVNLNGFLVEYDLYNLTVRHKSAVTGEAAYCLDVNNSNSQIAVGTEQGYLNIFSVNEDVLFEKFLDKQEGRILCLKYFPNGKYIASGSIDTVRIWNVKSGQAIHRITTGRAETNKETIVWDLQVTSEGIVISGDSRGKITFWDGKIGSQIESFQSHRADILSVCLSSDEKTLYCAGVDPLIISYEKVKVKGTSQKWVKSIQRKIHDHDVRCLILLKDKLYSCGIDGYLACSYHPPKTVHKFPPLLPSSCISISTERKIVLLQYSLQIELWELGKVDTGKEQEGLFKLDSLPKKLVQIFRTVKNSNNEEENEGIICSALSNDGKWIVFSTDTAVRIFNFKYVSW
ncbi:U3 small nucleolar RNA-associated protein 4 homolog [Agrilus planipennis]|uniref:U3 small nucleolar RNA-associated protein 4 homolog n=1 Tax=Agrilus planipennis TaxID=224129 RepID=A0A7F5RIP3_AGRPL|nr:U3 small nucleolar RNA-associated protein 4 homolog [Agrilus planipennis]